MKLLQGETMRLILRRRQPSDSEQIHKALTRALNREFKRQIKTLRTRNQLADIRRCAGDAAALAALRGRVNQTDISSLNSLEAVLDGLKNRADETRNATQVHASRILMPSDLLFGLHHRLFPAERMAVIAGRAVERQFVAGAVFDVTAERASHQAYTRADPDKLGAALVAIEKSGGRLVAWAHSHPGTGPAASFPSAIDHRQYAEWVVNYPELVGVILTGDGYVRFWGETVKATAIVPDLSGSGVERIDHDLYRISC